MPAMGLEPIRGCPQQILSLPRLPFRHAGFRTENYDNIKAMRWQAVFSFFSIFA